METTCPFCGDHTLQELIKRSEDFNIKCEKITVDVELYRCSVCKTEFEDFNSPYDPYVQAYNEYRRRNHMVQPDQIKDFRKKHDLTQKELSELLGFGAVTLSRYENGALQDEAHDTLLKLILDSNNLLSLIKEKPYVLSKEKQELIFKSSEHNFFINIESDFNDTDLTEFNGYQRFNINKVAQVIKFFCFNREVFKSKLVKLFYYSDFKNYKENKLSITGLKYAMLPKGPAPNDYQLLIGLILKYDSNITIKPRKAGKHDGEVLISHSPPDLTVFNNDEQKILNEVKNKFAFYTSSEIQENTHSEPVYKDVPVGEIIPYTYGETLNL